MKNLFLLLTLLSLASCGGGGGGGNGAQDSNGDTYENNSQECLEKELGWLSMPPMTLDKALKDMKNSKFEQCGGFEEYANKVQEEFRMFSLLRK
jgi:hypothetical protein